MKYLFAKMNAPFKEFHLNKVAFVTFNYDRSLDQFLFEALCAKYGKPEEECAEVLKQIPLIHVHGRLGYLPWEKQPGVRKYTSEVTARSIDACVRNIKVVHEMFGDEDFKEAFRLMADAQQVCFMGFGYAPTNMERLNVKGLQRQARGTAFGLTGKECGEVLSTCDSKIELFGELDCIGLLRNEVQWS